MDDSSATASVRPFPKIKAIRTFIISGVGSGMFGDPWLLPIRR